MHIYTCSLYFNASAGRHHAQRSHPAATPSCTKQFQPAKKKKNKGPGKLEAARSAGGYTGISSWQQKMLPIAATSTEQLFYRSLHSTTTTIYYYCWWRCYAAIVTDRLPSILLLLLYEVYCYGRWCYCYCYYYAPAATSTAATAATTTSLLRTAAYCCYWRTASRETTNCSTKSGRRFFHLSAPRDTQSHARTRAYIKTTERH